ncbi:MAG: SDR family oxidoreductase [Calditrichaeota bacterium]|nr:SDR family oxidoreductase [Calditrichota bacterium]
MNLGILDKKNVFITGATGGLGREIAAKLLNKGCNLFLTSLPEDQLRTLTEELRADCNVQRLLYYSACDLTRADEIEKIMQDVREKLINVDILINCAGIFPVKSLIETTETEFDICMNLNVKAPYLLSRSFVPDMCSKGWGRIVNIGSSSAYAGFAKTSLYCASKHALLGLSRSWHAELKDFGVRCFSVSPGSIKTPMGRQVPNQDYNTFIEPSDIADFVVFLITFDGNLVSDEVRLNRMFVR